MKHRFDKFESYTLSDCQCSLCLHHPGAGKPCPLERCCCEKEKMEALQRCFESKAPRPLRHRPNPLLPEKPVCSQKPKCEGCPYPAHGFICYSADGSCLKTITGSFMGDS